MARKEYYNAVLDGIRSMTFVSQHVDETGEEFKARYSEWPYAHEGETQEQCAARLQAVEAAQQAKHRAYQASILKEMHELDVREPFLNTLHAQINDECLSIRCRRYRLQEELDRVNKYCLR